jgi:hypothetical protein
VKKATWYLVCISEPCRYKWQAQVYTDMTRLTHQQKRSKASAKQTGKKKPAGPWQLDYRPIAKQTPGGSGPWKGGLKLYPLDHRIYWDSQMPLPTGAGSLYQLYHQKHNVDSVPTVLLGKCVTVRTARSCLLGLSLNQEQMWCPPHALRVGPQERRDLILTIP